MRTLLAATLLFSSVAMAQTDVNELEKQLNKNPNDQAVLLQLGIAYHDVAAMSDPSAIDKSAKYLRKVMQQEEKHPVAMAYLGSLHTIMGREAEMPEEKLSYVSDGIDLMDQAIELASQNLQVRLVRAFNSIHLPDFFHRLQYAIKDLSFITEAKEFAYWPAAQQAMVFFNFGVALEKGGKKEMSRSYFTKTIEVDEKSPWAAQAAEKLKQVAGDTDLGQGHE